MQVEAEAENQHKMLKVDRRESNPTLEELEVFPSNTRVASAPHTTSICSVAYIAINKRCSVHGSVLENPPSGSQIHEEAHHIQSLPDHPNSSKTSDVLRKFLQKLKLTRIYKFEIIDPLDFNGQFSFPTVLITLWKFIGIHEKDLCNEKEFRRIFDELATEFELNIEGKNDIIEATLHGSQYWVYLLTEKNSAKRTAKIGNFAEKYDIVFLRTNLHSADFTPQLHGSIQKSYGLQTQFEDDFNGDIPTFMISHTTTNLETPSYQSLDVEIDCLTAMASVHKSHPKIVLGYESQQGGVLVLLSKGNFSNDEILRTIARSISTASKKPVASITFQLLEPSAGLSILSISDARGLPLEKKAVIEMEVKTNSPARKSNEMNEEKKEEEQEEDVADQADETFDKE